MFDINFPKFLGRSRVKLDVIVLYVTPKLLLPRSFLTKTRHPFYYLALTFRSSWVWQKILVLSVPQTNKVGYLLLQMLSRSSKSWIWKSISYNGLIKVSFWIDLHFAYNSHLHTILDVYHYEGRSEVHFYPMERYRWFQVWLNTAVSMKKNPVNRIFLFFKILDNDVIKPNKSLYFL